MTWEGSWGSRWAALSVGDSVLGDVDGEGGRWWRKERKKLQVSYDIRTHDRSVNIRSRLSLIDGRV
jgi:hypothetical protein